MKILILGGTGFLGPHTVNAALARRHEVVLFNRGKTNPNLFPELEKLAGDRKDPEALAQLKDRKFDAVVDTSGYFPKHVKMSAELLAPNVKQYIFISSISAYAERMGGGELDESAPVGKLEDPNLEKMSNEVYGPLKAACEAAAEAAMPGRTANIRPGLIVGPEDPTDRFTYWPARLDRGGEVLCPGPRETPVQWIDARDLAEFIVTTIEQGHVGVYNAVGPLHRHTIADLVHACRAATTSDAKLTWVDAAFLAENEVGPWMEMPLWIPADENGEAAFSTVSNKKGTSVGMTFRPLADTVRDTLAWSRTRPADHRWGAGLAAEKEKKVLAAWHARNPSTRPS
jgi:2'-hydroxyisoflavone reductase